MTLGFAEKMLLRSADFRRILRPNTLKNRKSALRRGILFTNPEVMHRLIDVAFITSQEKVKLLCCKLYVLETWIQLYSIF